ncbi:MAG: hypothetical protein H6858_06980 [Rhodospirillales bacterium]|nr:hypothetical protein [Alphaproteobacteria bacterium]MCB1840418.1 hypothetical protein [Alphaproteobacteria bacterium]MCB9977323.1 hypothetical protein [Rhodospirillales bacterium]
MADEHTLRDMVETIRQAVVEAFSREHNPEEAEIRSALVNALQGILEKSSPNGQGQADLDFDDLYVLVQHRATLIDAALIHERHFGNTVVGDVLRQVADHIETAQKYVWQPPRDGMDFTHEHDDRDDDHDLHPTTEAVL